MIPALLFLLALLGLAIATYFTGVSYRLISPAARFVPRACRLGEDSCRKVVDTRQARVFGVPNSLLGMFFYLALLGLAVLGEVSPSLMMAYEVVAWGTVGLGAFLAWNLLFVIRVPCPLCFTAHGLNLAIALILSLGW
jgi:uncharacterized membrane protein